MNCGVKIGEKQIVQAAARRDNYGHPVAVQFSLQVSLQHCSAWSPSQGARPQWCQCFFQWVFITSLDKDKLLPPPIIWFSIAMEGEHPPMILHNVSPAGSAAVTSFTLLGAAHISVHWNEQERRTGSPQVSGRWLLMEDSGSSQRLWLHTTLSVIPGYL